MYLKSKKYDSISINLLFTYLSILIVPLIAIVIIYFTANSILVENQTNKIESSLKQTSSYISNALQDASNLALYISDSKEIRNLLKSESSYFDYYKYVQNSVDYQLINNTIAHVYIFFSDNKFIIKDKTVVPAKDIFYRSIDKLDEHDYHAMINTISDADKASVRLSEQENKLFVLQKFPYAQFDNYKGMIAVVLNDKLITNLLAENHIDGYGFSLMLKPIKDNILLQNYSIGRQENIKIDNLDIHAVLYSAQNSIVLNQQEYILSTHKDSYGYIYINATPKQVILSRGNSIKMLIVALSITSIILALSICILLWRRRRNLLIRISAHKNYFEYSNNANTPKTIWDSISNMLDGIIDLQNNIKLQEGFIRTSIIRKIILGLYDDEESLNKDLSTIHGKMDSKRFLVTALNIKFQHSETKHKDLRLLIKNEFSQFEIPNLYCELSSDKIAVIFFVKNEKSVEILKDKLTELKNHFYEEWNIISYIGIGQEVSELIEISLSYDSAQKTSDYLYYNDMRTIMFYYEVNNTKDVFFYPIETELHLIKAIKTLDIADARDILRVLHYENYEHRKLSSHMNMNFISMLKASLLRELENHKEPPINVEVLRNLNQFDEIEKYIESLMGAIQNNENEKNSLLKQHIMDQIEEQFSNPNFTLFELSKIIGMSETKMYKAFKELFSVSFSEYLENHRINKACELLRQKVQIKDVAGLVGYSSDFSFRRAFKRSMGIPPSYYSEGLKKNP